MLPKVSQIFNPNVDVLFYVWFFVLPVLAIILLIVAPIFWFIIVPKFARTITWQRFKKSIAIGLADDSGWFQIVFSKRQLPEGMVETTRGKRDWRFLPRPKWRPSNPADKDYGRVQDILLRKFIWKDLGKPFWLGHAGKVTLANPVTLAALEQTKDMPSDITLKKIQDYILRLPESVRKDLLNLLEELKNSLKAKSITFLDPRKIKEVIPTAYPHSGAEELATYCELYGMELRGREYGKLIFGLATIIGLVILGIIAINFLMQ